MCLGERKVDYVGRKVEVAMRMVEKMGSRGQVGDWKRVVTVCGVGGEDAGRKRGRLMAGSE